MVVWLYTHSAVSGSGWGIPTLSLVFVGHSIGTWSPSLLPTEPFLCQQPRPWSHWTPPSKNKNQSSVSFLCNLYFYLSSTLFSSLSEESVLFSNFWILWPSTFSRYFVPKAIWAKSLLTLKKRRCALEEEANLALALTLTLGKEALEPPFVLYWIQYKIWNRIYMSLKTMLNTWPSWHSLLSTILKVRYHL